MLQVGRGPYDPNLPHPARRLGQLHDTVHVQSALYCKCYNYFSNTQTAFYDDPNYFTSLRWTSQKTEMPLLWRVGTQKVFVPHPPAKVDKEKKHRKKVFAIFKWKMIIIKYMTFVTMNYVFEFTFLLRTSISLVNTCVHFCFLDAMYKMPWLHGMHNSQFWKQVDLL